MQQRITFQQWREASSLSRKQAADLLTAVLKGRTITPSHVQAIERGHMPGWDLGEAIALVTGGKVRPSSFV